MQNQSEIVDAFVELVYDKKLQFPFYLSLLLKLVFSFKSKKAFKIPPRKERDIITLLSVESLMVFCPNYACLCAFILYVFFSC